MEYNNSCIDLEDYHDGVSRMECLRDGSDTIYHNTTHASELSGTYKVTCYDGAELIVLGRYSTALCCGTFAIWSDSTGVTSDKYGNDARVLAYMARHGKDLIRDYPHECELLSYEKAQEELKAMGVPHRGLHPFGEMATANFEKWAKEVEERGLVRYNEQKECWEMTFPQIREGDR